MRHAFNDDMVLDIAAYNRDVLSDAAGRTVSIPDPTAQNSLTEIRVLTNADFGNTRGVDVRLDRRFGNYFSGTLAYTFQQAKNTGDDPITYLGFGSRIVSQLGGGNSPPPAGDPHHLEQPAAHAGFRRQPELPGRLPAGHGGRRDLPELRGLRHRPVHQRHLVHRLCQHRAEQRAHRGRRRHQQSLRQR